MFDSVYVSRVFAMGAADAVEATEAWYGELERTPGRRRLVGAHKLFLRPSFAPTEFDPLLLRRLRGTLWVGWWWPVRVELELARYSRFASEIAIRPTTLHWPVGMERYGQDAAKAVEDIVCAITVGAQVRAARPESKASVTSCTAHTLMPSPHGLADRIARRPRVFDPLSD